jgi:hypothetical protein
MGETVRLSPHPTNQGVNHERNAKVVLALLFLLVVLGVVGAMDYEDARREERSFNSGEPPPVGDCSNGAEVRPNEGGSACVVSLPGH